MSAAFVLMVVSAFFFFVAIFHDRRYLVPLGLCLLAVAFICANVVGPVTV